MEERDSKGRYVKKYLDIKGQRFFRLVALDKVSVPNSHHAFWRCKCDCGKEIIVRKDSLLSGHAKSCGCYLQERYHDGHLITHGDNNKKLYKTFLGMKQRCYNPKCESYEDYGARGIKICPEWLNSYETFREWSYANGFDDTKKGHDMTIDRIDVNGNYDPSNCRWVGHEVQNYNKRCTIRITINGKEMTLKEISETYHIPLKTLRPRGRKYRKGLITLEDLLKTPKGA